MKTHAPEQQISAWLDGQLEPAETAELEAHLSGCDNCRELRQELDSANRLFRDLEPAKLPPYLWTRVAAELEHPRKQNPFSWLQWQGTWYFARRELLAAAALLVFVVTGTVGVVLDHRSTVRFEMSAIAQLDSIHDSLVARSSEVYNPFRSSGWTNTNSNPFKRRQLDADSNPFRSLREKR